MKLSNGEKLILMMLSEVYQKLEIDGEIDPKFLKNVLLSDNTWALQWEYDGVLGHTDDETPPIVKEVADILTMWLLIERAYNNLPVDDKNRLHDEFGIDEKDATFEGFDGNNESEHMGIARCLIGDLKRFSEFDGRYMNAHHSTLDHYQKMLDVFNPMLSNLRGRGFLNITELSELLNSEL